jgi:hypothetical protein
MSMFKKAERTQARLRLAIAGPSGSGKTYTALAIATHLSPDKPIALVDTESGSAVLYGGDFNFDVMEMAPPFSPQKFMDAIKDASASGYGVIILDSLSHAWAGPGGLLDIVDKKAKTTAGGNSYAAWKEGTPLQNELIQTIIRAPIHVIATVRSKTEYAMDKDANGRTTIKKMGLKAVQRDDLEYDFTIWIDMNMDHEGFVAKSRCSALADGLFSRPGKNIADPLIKWLNEGAPDAAQAIETATTPAAPTIAHTAHKEAQAPQKINVAPVEVTVQGKDDFDRVLNELLEEEDDTLNKAFHATGSKTFGNDWNNGARKWLITEYTRAKTPNSIRSSSKDLVNSERQALIDDMSKNGPARVKKYAQSQKVVTLETQMHSQLVAAAA